VCSECVENATLSLPNSCECNENYLYNALTHTCERICHPYCAECPSDVTNYRCTECNADHFMLPNTTICYDFCPNGLVEVGTTCEVIDPYEACVVFDNRFVEKNFTGDTNIRTQGGENLDEE